MKNKLKIIKKIPSSYFRGYFWTNESLFRIYQDQFLAFCGENLSGSIVEVGGEKKYGHKKFFRNADSFLCTNINRDYDEYADIMKLPYKSESLDACLCVSVLEHIYDFKKAFQEMHRVLKPGGSLILTVPFAYPFHDSVDYWRFARSAYDDLLKDYEIIECVNLGGVFSTLTEVLQRPRGNFRGRYFIYKTVGFLTMILAKWLEIPDGFPLGYGVLAVKK